MKKKLLSLFLALSMLLTSVLCLLPVAAEPNYDTLAAAEGYVCRIGDANAEFTGYYKFFSAADTNYVDGQPNALVEAFKAGNEATITLINTINVSQQVSSSEDSKYLHGSVVVRSGKKLVVDGNGQTYNTKWSFRADGGEIVVKNCNILLKDGATECYGDVRGNGTLTYENCTFSSEAQLKRDNYFIAINPKEMATMTLKDCTVNINDNASNGGKIFWSNAGSKFTLNLDNVKVDASAYGSKAGFVIGDGNLNITGGSVIKVGGNAIDAANVTIADSSLTTVTASFGNIFNYANKSIAVNVRLLNATLNAKKYAFSITGCKAAVNVSLDGATVVDGAQRAFSITNNTNAVNIVAKGNTEIRSTAIANVNDAPTEGAGNAIYVCGQQKVVINADKTTTPIKKDFSAESFTLTLKDNAKLISSGNVISFSHSSSWINKATITAVGNVTITAGSDKYLIETCSGLADGAITYTESDNTKLEAKAWTTSESKATKISVPAPKMGFGASVRLVEGSSGLRFSSTLTKLADGATVKLVKNGTLIAIYDELGENDFTIAALEAAGIEFANIPATEDGTVAGDVFNTYNAALTNIPAAYGDKKFVARAYAIYEINGVEYYVYADFSEDNVRDFYYVCNEALKDVKTDADFEKDENLRTEYPFEITTGKWSPYTKAQRELLDSLIPDDKKKQ